MRTAPTPPTAKRIPEDRARAADHGVQVIDVANALRLLVEGVQVSTYEEHREQYEVHVRADSAYRADAQGLRLLTVPSARLAQLPLSDVAELRNGSGPARINRLNLRRQLSITANVAPGAGESVVVDELKKIITVPFAFISLFIFKQALDIYSALGILVLFGVVKKNATLQSITRNQLGRGGMPRLPAILQRTRTACARFS